MNAVELPVLLGSVVSAFLFGRLLGIHFDVLGWVSGVVLGVAVWGLVWWGVGFDGQASQASFASPYLSSR